MVEPSTQHDSNCLSPDPHSVQFSNELVLPLTVVRLVGARAGMGSNLFNSLISANPLSLAHTEADSTRLFGHACSNDICRKELARGNRHDH